MRRNLKDVTTPPQKPDRAGPVEPEIPQFVDGLRALRQIAGRGQADVAAALKIKQPSVSKIEKQADMHISTLRSYVEAVGGELELTVRLPKRPAVRIHTLGEAAARVCEGFAPLAKASGAR